MHTIKSGLLILFTALFFFKTKAQENEVQLDPVTITASVNPLSLSKTGRNLLVITADRISRLPVNSIDELLRYLPGIEVQARGPMGTQSDFVLRGGTFQQVLVLLDGLRINDPLTGHFNSYIPITPAEIDHIEILKGASSAIYGTEAVGGVIQIISKSFAQKEAVSKKSFQGGISSGQYGLLNASAGGFYSKGRTAVSGGFLSNNAAGQAQRGIDGFFHLLTVSLSASRQLSENWKIAIRSSYDNRHFAAQNFYTTFSSDTAEESVKTVWNQVKLEYTKKGDHFEVQAGYKRVQDNYLFNKSSLANLNKSGLFQTLATYTHPVTDKTIITGGAQFQNRTIRSNDRGNHAVSQRAVFVLLDQTVGESFHINPALRLDWNEQSGSELVPQVNLSYHFSKLQLRGSAGKTIREADFTERYNNYGKSIVRSGSIGNPDLASERSFSFEAGADYFLKSNLKISTSYFKRHHKDLIDYVATPYSDMPRKENLVSTGTYALAKNIARVTTKGFEADAQFSKKVSATYSIWSSLGLVWLHSKSSEPAPSFYITSHAKFLANYMVLLSAPQFTLSVNGLYKVREPKEASAIITKITKDYFVMNTKGEVFVWKKKISVVAQVDNVFDRTYSDLLGAQMPLRWWMLGAKVTL